MSRENLIEIQDAYFKVLIGEISNSRLVSRGFSRYVEIPWKEYTFRARRVRIVGKVADISEGRGYVDCLLVDSTGQIVVRGWAERADSIKALNVNDTVEVFGYIREFRGDIYVNPIIIARAKDEVFEARGREIEEVRRYLVKKIGGLPEK